jgi:hypothetical protein
MIKTWTTDVENRLIELLTEREVDTSLSEQKIANVLSEEFDAQFTRDMVHSKIGRIDRVFLYDKPRLEFPYIDKYSRAMKNGSPASGYTVKENMKILCMNDLHMPYEDKEIVDIALKMGAAADLVIVSEMLDLTSLNPFSNKPFHPLSIEIDYGLRFLEYLSENFPQVIIISSNHEGRITRELSRNLPGDLQFMVEEDNLMRIMAKPFPNITVLDDWKVIINDAIFAHADIYSSVEAKTSLNLNGILEEWGDIIGVNNYHLLVQGHTHHMSTIYKPNLKIMESGCLSLVPKWKLDKLTRTPWSTGFVIVKQENGKTNLNATREYFYTPKVANLDEDAYIFS